MRIAIVGTGYVGLVTGACFAELGVEVVCIDVDEAKISALRAGSIPIYEPGLEALVQRNAQAGRLHFSTSLRDELEGCDVVFIAVGTPPGEDGSADLQYVLQVAHTIGENLQHYVLVVTKSTVPVGTSVKVRAAIAAGLQARGVEVGFDVASNPEFLKEGDAISDFMKPDRVVVGVDSERAQALMEELYRPMQLSNFRVLFMDIASAELTKYAANSMLALRISFMNELANLCERVGGDIQQVRRGIGADTRIGSRFLYAGCGYGGSCFPKDVRALARSMQEVGLESKILASVEAVNEAQKRLLFQKFSDYYRGAVSGKRAAIWGLSFKPGTDDMREAPSLVLIDALLAAGCEVSVFDPIAMPSVRACYGDKLRYAVDAYDAVDDADVLFHVTEWKVFRMPNWEVIRRAMRHPLLIDGRNVYDPSQLHGIAYMGVGVPSRAKKS